MRLNIANGARNRTRAVFEFTFGLNTPASDEPVMVILEASDVEIFYVCTYSHGVLDGVPFSLALAERGRAIDFDESPGTVC